jgi:hypothetical protein
MQRVWSNLACAVMKNQEDPRNNRVQEQSCFHCCSILQRLVKCRSQNSASVFAFVNRDLTRIASLGIIKLQRISHPREHCIPLLLRVPSARACDRLIILAGASGGGRRRLLCSCTSGCIAVEQPLRIRHVLSEGGLALLQGRELNHLHTFVVPGRRSLLRGSTRDDLLQLAPEGFDYSAELPAAACIARSQQEFESVRDQQASKVHALCLYYLATQAVFLASNFGPQGVASQSIVLLCTTHKASVVLSSHQT